MRVKIPFDRRFAPWMLEGIKKYDPRSSPVLVYDRLRNRMREARSGDYFHAFGAVFRIHAVDSMALGAIAQRGCRAAGFACPGDFIDYWNEYHPVQGYNPDFTVRLYWFNLSDPALAATVTANNWCPFCPIDRAPGDGIPCEHFIGYAGQVEPDPDNVMIRTPVSCRIYRMKGARLAASVR